MTLASAQDVEDRLRRSLTDEESESVDGLIAEASGLVEAWCGTEWPDVVPVRVTLAVSRMVARVFTTAASSPAPENSDSVQMGAGPYQVTRSYSEGQSGGGPWIAKADRLLLRAYRITGAFSVEMA